MNYHITCLCGERISVTAENDEAAVKALIPAMDKHVAAKEHPDYLYDRLRRRGQL